MEKLTNLDGIKKVHIIGIGGISTSGIAKILLSHGIKVTGSDRVSSVFTEELKALGVKVYIGHKSKNVEKDTDLVIYSLAIKDSNPELVIAKKLNIKAVKRGEALGLISREYKHTIAIAGMHGKTTTTAIIYKIFKDVGFDPTLHIGGEIDNEHKNIVLGSKDYFITEACEYGDSFLSLTPEVSIINNVEREHLDYFKNLKNIYKSFNRFMIGSKVCFVDGKQKGKLITLDDRYFDNGYLNAKNIKKEQEGFSFDVFEGDDFWGRVRLNVPGRYNIHNALGAIMVAKYYGISKQSIIKSLCEFKSVKRRFEGVGKVFGHKVIFDYAHHPTEIKNAIKTAKELNAGKVYVYFQPHTYSRTKSLKDLFKKCFSGADSVFICSTFKAREKFDPEADEKALSELVESVRHESVKSGDIETIIKDIKEKKEKGVLLFVGAGDMQSKVKVAFGL